VFDLGVFDVRVFDVRVFDVRVFDVRMLDVRMLDVRMLDVRMLDVRMLDVRMLDVRMLEIVAASAGPGGERCVRCRGVARSRSVPSPPLGAGPPRPPGEQRAAAKQRPASEPGRQQNRVGWMPLQRVSDGFDPICFRAELFSRGGVSAGRCFCGEVPRRSRRDRMPKMPGGAKTCRPRLSAAGFSPPARRQLG
jgi:hypothetical protein